MQLRAADVWMLAVPDGQIAPMATALAQRMRTTLLNHAVTNIVQLDPQGALTGPAARGDTALVSAQAHAVATWDDQAGAAYRALSQLAAQLAQRPCA